MKRLHLNKTTTIILMMVLDVAIVVFSAVFCLQLRFDISNFHMIPYEYLHRVSVGIPGCVVVTIAVM